MKNSLVVTMIVKNPNFQADTLRILNLSISKEKLKMKLKEFEPSKIERLKALTDRIEFIEHLKVVKDNCTSVIKKESQYIDDRDQIDSLRLYLALTCVDIFAKVEWKHFSEWLIENSLDFTNNLKVYIKRKSKKYEELFGVGTNFRQVFDNAPEIIKDFISENFSVAKVKSGDDEIIKEIIKEIKDIIPPKKNKESIASSFGQIRNSYTHDGRLFFFNNKSYTLQVQFANPRNIDYLAIAPQIDVISIILDVAKAQACKELNFTDRNSVLNQPVLSCSNSLIGKKIVPIKKETDGLENIAYKILKRKIDSKNFISNDKKSDLFHNFINRVAFIDKLAEYQEECKGKSFRLNGKEVEGIQYDINALRLYLALTCVDMVSKRIDFRKWLEVKPGIKDSKMSFEDYVKSRVKDYKEEIKKPEYFIGAFFEAGTPKQDFEKNLKVTSRNNGTVSDITSISRFLLDIRNKFTHEGVRVHYDKEHENRQVVKIGIYHDPPLLHDPQLLIEPHFDLVQAILQVAKEKAIQYFNI